MMMSNNSMTVITSKGEMFLNNEKNMDEFNKAVKELIKMAKKKEEK